MAEIPLYHCYACVVAILGLYGNIDIGEVNVEDPDSINDDKEYGLTTIEAGVFVE